MKHPANGDSPEIFPGSSVEPCKEEKIESTDAECTDDALVVWNLNWQELITPFLSNLKRTCGYDATGSQLILGTKRTLNSADKNLIPEFPNP